MPLFGCQRRTNHDFNHDFNHHYNHCYNHNNHHHGDDYNLYRDCEHYLCNQRRGCWRFDSWFSGWEATPSATHVNRDHASQPTPEFHIDTVYHRHHDGANP